jgi:SHS2 domain-containing protein
MLLVVERGHRQVEHTADLALEFWGATEVEVLRAGADALVEILTDGATPTADAVVEVDLEAVDPADRLVRWLGEVLYLAMVEGFLVVEADLTLHEGGLRGTLRGEADARDRLTTEIKAATYHDLHLGTDGVRWTARVVLDV